MITNILILRPLPLNYTVKFKKYLRRKQLPFIQEAHMELQSYSLIGKILLKIIILQINEITKNNLKPYF